MDIKSAIAGAGAVVLVAGGVFFAVSASNAQEQVEPEAVVEDTYDGPYVYWQAPEPLPHITVPPPAPEPVVTVEPEPVVVEEPAVSKPAPVQTDPKPQPEPDNLVVETPQGPLDLSDMEPGESPIQP